MTASGGEAARLSPQRRANLELRARALAALRGFFVGRGFLEVETPLLVPSPGLEVHLAAVAAGKGWLITSPEYQMKRLLAGGLTRIFQVCKCFRGEEEGAHHSSEFTMLEWYRGGDQLAAIEDDTQGLVEALARAVNGGPVVRVGERQIDVAAPWTRLSMREAMQRWGGIDVVGDEPEGELLAKVVAAGVRVGTATAWDDVFYTAFLERVEPALAAEPRPVLIVDWPVRLAALARRKPGNPAVVERFEAYLGGVELANAFGELVDPVEQRARFVEEQELRRQRGLPVYPIDEKLLAALPDMPPSAGIALGVDRLMMLLAGADHIRDVLTLGGDEL